MPPRQPDRQPAPKQPSFEDQMRRLESIIEELERPDLPLERNVALYKEGRALAASCKELLDKARHEVTLSAGEEGAVPFVSGDSSANNDDDRP